MNKKNEQSISMTFTKSTTGTHVYGCADADTPIPAVYIRREALPKNPPAELTLTLQWSETNEN